MIASDPITRYKTTKLALVLPMSQLHVFPECRAIGFKLKKQTTVQVIEFLKVEELALY